MTSVKGHCVESRIQNPMKYLRRSLSAEIVNGFQTLTIFAKGSVLDVWQGSAYASRTT